jgi:2-polyprenyl-6-methoxyphenol hydroxylase-like FAD-dependent oxidoreductase
MTPVAREQEETAMEAPPKQRYDAIVVGARCAGAATAMLLARRGLSVLLFDRDRRGADTLSTLALMRAGVLQLHRWGLLEQVRAAGAPDIRSTSFVYGDEVVTVPIKPRDGVDAFYAPRRKVLDQLLGDAAAAAGADVRYGPRLAELLRDPGGRVTGVILEERGGALHRIGADIVIGADGLRSTVARMVEAATYHEGRHAAGVVYAFWRGLENQGNRWHYRPGMSVGAIPTNDDDTCIFVAIPSQRFHDEIHADLEGGYRRVLSECAPALARALSAAQPSERYRGFPGQAGIMRQSHGPGWALVGDAGYFKDPITAHGISDALRDAEFLARAVERGSDEAMAQYQSNRDELSRELCEITDAIAGFEWDFDILKSLHKHLSKVMNHEVEALLGLDGLAHPPSPGLRERSVQGGG